MSKKELLRNKKPLSSIAYKCDKTAALFHKNYDSPLYSGAVHFVEKDRSERFGSDPENRWIELFREKINNWFIICPDACLYSTQFDFVELSTNGYSFRKKLLERQSDVLPINERFHVDCKGEIDSRSNTGLSNVELSSHFSIYISEERKLSIESLAGYDSEKVIYLHNVESDWDPDAFLFHARAGYRLFELENDVDGRTYSYSGFVDENNNVAGDLRVEICRALPEEAISDRIALEFNKKVLSTVAEEEKRFVSSMLYYIKPTILAKLNTDESIVLQNDDTIVTFDSNNTPRILAEKTSKRWNFSIFNGAKTDKIYGLVNPEDNSVTQIMGRVNNVLVYLDVNDKKQVPVLDIIEKINNVVEKTQNKPRVPSKQTGNVMYKRMPNTRKLTQLHQNQ